MHKTRAQYCTFKGFMSAALRNIRERRNITQEQLATALNCDRTYISALERGKKNINLRFLDRFVPTLFNDNGSFVNTVLNEFEQECRRKREAGFCDRNQRTNFWCPQGIRDDEKEK